MDNEALERAHAQGKQTAWISILHTAIQALGYSLSEMDQARVAWIAERAEAIRALRELCGAHGDNDWPDDLYVPDIIEKHLARHLD